MLTPKRIVFGSVAALLASDLIQAAPVSNVHRREVRMEPGSTHEDKS
jgi:hypothetical protein